MTTMTMVAVQKPQRRKAKELQAELEQAKLKQAALERKISRLEKIKEELYTSIDERNEYIDKLHRQESARKSFMVLKTLKPLKWKEQELIKEEYYKNIDGHRHTYSIDGGLTVTESLYTTEFAGSYSDVPCCFTDENGEASKRIPIAAIRQTVRNNKTLKIKSDVLVCIGRADLNIDILLAYALKAKQTTKYVLKIASHNMDQRGKAVHYLMMRKLGMASCILGTSIFDKGILDYSLVKKLVKTNSFEGLLEEGIAKGNFRVRNHENEAEVKNYFEGVKL